MISRTLHVFNGLETEAQEMAHLKRPIDEGGAGAPYLPVKARLLGERLVFGRRTRVGPRRHRVVSSLSLITPVCRGTTLNLAHVHNALCVQRDYCYDIPLTPSLPPGN